MPPLRSDLLRGKLSLQATKHPRFITENLTDEIIAVRLPLTAGGTVRRKAVTVAIATSSGLYLMEQLCPAVTMLGLRRVPSRYTWWSDIAL